MNTKAELRKFSGVYEQAAFIVTIKSITRARKMKIVKMEIEKIEHYLSGASATYRSSKLSFASGARRGLRALILKNSLRQTSRRRILVLISSQDYYYGKLIPTLFDLFIGEFRRGSADGLILGNIGAQMLEAGKMKVANITTFDFNLTDPDWSVIHQVSQILGDYREIVIFYVQHKSVFTQEALRAEVTSTFEVSLSDDIKKYLFKPQAPESLSYLERQMVTGNFLQKLYESQLAKYGAQIKDLELGQVAEKMAQAIEQLGRNRRKVRKTVNNKKQLQLFTGLNLWQKGPIF